MRLVRLVYCSRIDDKLTTAGVADLARKAAERNKADYVTGVLFYGSGAFLQVLEGPRSRVNALYARLLADPRHRDLQLLDVSEIDERWFESFSMAHTTLDEVLGTRIGRQQVLRYSSGFIDPFEMTAASALGFLREIGVVLQQRVLEPA